MSLLLLVWFWLKDQSVGQAQEHGANVSKLTFHNSALRGALKLKMQMLLYFLGSVKTYLQVVLDETSGITKSIRIYPLRTMNYFNPSNSC